MRIEGPGISMPSEYKWRSGMSVFLCAVSEKSREYPRFQSISRSFSSREYLLSELDGICLLGSVPGRCIFVGLASD